MVLIMEMKTGMNFLIQNHMASYNRRDAYWFGGSDIILVVNSHYTSDDDNKDHDY